MAEGASSFRTEVERHNIVAPAGARLFFASYDEGMLRAAEAMGIRGMAMP